MLAALFALVLMAVGAGALSRSKSATTDTRVHSLPHSNADGSVELLVGGRFGSVRTLALDASGRTLAYGGGSGYVMGLSVCPGRRRVAEAVGFDKAGVVTGYTLAIREWGTLRLVRQQPLGHSYYGDPLRCVSADGNEVVVFSSGGPDHPERGRITRITPRKEVTIWRGAWNASFAQGLAYVQINDPSGMRLVAVNLRSGTPRTLGTVPVVGAYGLVPNAAGTRLAGSAYNEARACCPRVVVIDLERRPILARQIPLATEFGSVLWLGNDRFAYCGERDVLIYTSQLRVSRRFFGWRAGCDVSARSTMFGLRADGTLVTAKLPSGRVKVVRRLRGEPRVMVSATR